MRTYLNRREFSAGMVATVAGTGWMLETHADSKTDKPFQLNYMLASSMYGHIYLGDILPEVTKSGATAIDLWPRKHGSQREQLDAIGVEKYMDMVAKYGIKTGCLTRYDLGTVSRITELNDELKLAGRLGCNCVVTSGFGPHQVKGSELKAAVKTFVETLRPTIDIADQNGVRLSIENHAKNLIDSPDSLKWLAEFAPSSGLAIALAPYHLDQDTRMIGELIETLGPAISLFYAWEHGMGCMTKLPKDQELMQLPGRGELDFRPLLAAFKRIGFDGWTEIFMHPVPRGIPILESETLVTQEINRARSHLDQIVSSL